MGFENMEVDEKAHEVIQRKGSNDKAGKGEKKDGNEEKQEGEQQVEDKNSKQEFIKEMDRCLRNLERAEMEVHKLLQGTETEIEKGLLLASIVKLRDIRDKVAALWAEALDLGELPAEVMDVWFEKMRKVQNSGSISGNAESRHMLTPEQAAVCNERTFKLR